MVNSSFADKAKNQKNNEEVEQLRALGYELRIVGYSEKYRIENKSVKYLPLEV